MNQQFIDLGLPSGTLWAAENEDGYFTFDEAVEKFGNSLPTKEQFEELIEHTDKYWDLQKKGMWFVSKKNGGKIFMPASGYRYGADTYDLCYSGHYYSASPFYENNAYCLSFTSSSPYLHWDSRKYSIPVRLVSSK